MPHERALRVAAARADFLESGRVGAAGVPDLLAASWERSHAAGVDPQRPEADFTDDIDTGSRLVRCAQPVLAQLASDTSDLPLTIALTDSRARLIKRVDMSPAVGRLLDRVAFAPGFNYAEDSMGTNGVGTVIESGQSVAVVGPEHYTENLQAFACTGAPVVDPLTGRVEGILDLSTLTASWSPIMHTLVKSAAKDIGRNLLMDRSQAQQALFDTYLRASVRSTKQGVFAFAESVFMANAAAQSLFDPVEQLAIREHVSFVLQHRDRCAETITLSSGRVVQCRGVRIVSGSQTAGVVIADVLSRPAETALPAAAGGFADRVLPEVAVASEKTALIADDLRLPHVPIAGGSSAAWVRAGDQLREALTARRSTIVLGETGSGKFTLVAELFHADQPGGRSVSIEPSQFQAEVDGGLEALIDGSPDPTLCIVRNIDQATTADVDSLDRLFTAIAGTGGQVSLAATVSDSSLDSDLPFHTLLGHFDVAVTIPPLRCRTEDLTHIVARLVEQIAPRRKVRLSPEALRLIARYTWPRNVAQLREALVHALRSRPVGELQAEDLPSYCHTSSRKTLTVLEAAERDAIVAALTECGGNRVAAAAAVGMSRSSLYRKIRVYGITA
ncbi:sigma-54-dependent Fis family transcriptional regulator [Kribbia dieselivorans]|uniref:sigma-54-dependent Fis family transcriptional regulator n=1 Tax=Kribbia dieselivorans TaxID=331526 RepID=UPI00083840A5|nr:helix-turn-helix domain-containing protein [Kribbia dieselivorans]